MISFWNTLAATMAQRGATSSEPDLMAQWPVAGIGLQLLGLVADVYLVLRWRQRRNVGAKPWGLSALFAAVGVSLAVFLSVGIVGYLLRLTLASSLALLAGAELALFAVLLLCLHIEKIQWNAAFGLGESSVTHALLMGVVFFLAVQPPLLALGTLRDWLFRVFDVRITVQDLVLRLMGADSGRLIVVVIVFAVLVAPLCEEVFFRGLTYPVLKQRWGKPVALIVTSLLFAVIHFHLPSLPLLIALAIGLALAYEYTGSLLTSITMHALFNLLNVVAILLYRANP
jgi:membrane protease YdiL (CAAX protease family)